MTAWRKAILWMCGILVWIFALSIGLAWFQFGYLDLQTAAAMGLILIPLLIVAIGVLLRMDIKESVEEGKGALDEHPVKGTDKALGENQ